MKKFLRSNKTRDRLLRTILQGVLGVLVANVDLLVSSLTIPIEYKPMIVALVMAVLSPIMSELGKETELAENTNDAEDPACDIDEDLGEEGSYGND